MNKKNFSEPPKDFDFIANERKLLDWWYKSGIVKKYLAKNSKAKKRFSFIDGPITANNPMGVHHAWGRTLKDLYQRYKNMQGFEQRFQNGFDCQGLWIEVEVEKEKGFKSKKDIENYGVGKFIEDCKDRVKKYSQIQTDQSKRLGYFMDWNNSYYTMSNENNYMIWAFLKKCWQEGNLYKGHDTVPWCPRCGTAVTQHEIGPEEYKTLTHDSVYMRFPVIKDGQLKNDEFLLVWTTTPWTVPADTLVAVSPNVEYAKVLFEEKYYWLAKSLIKSCFNQDLTPIKVVNGKELIEKEKITHYSAGFDDLPIIKNLKEKSPNHFHAIVLSKDLVTESEGTGLVHIVPGSGTEDHQLVKHDLKWLEVIFPVVDETGAYLEGYGELTGKNAKEHPELIIDYLREKENGLYLLKTKPYNHQYPTCWRCKTELIWRLVDEWYIKMDNPRPLDDKTLRERMMAVAKKINWLPKWGRERELDWLKNMRDWLISKKRYWGLALPIWECKKCSHFEVFDHDDLEKRVKNDGKCDPIKEIANGWKQFAGHTPHRPFIDEVKIRCPKCGQLMTRVPDVGTPWLDAGIVNFSTLVNPETGELSYLTDKKYFEQWYPADFVTECYPGQFRNWFYAMIAMSTTLEDTEPFKVLLGHALVRDEKGEEMHKSKGNAIWFDEVADKMGVDTMRWLYCHQDPEFNLNFGYKIGDEVRRQFIFLYWNTYKYFVTYANLNGLQPFKNSKHETRSTKQKNSNFKQKKIQNVLNLKNLDLEFVSDFDIRILDLNVLDRWILSRLESAKKQVTEKLDSFHHHIAIAAIENFLGDLSTWYIRRSRDRVSPTNENVDDRNACLATLYKVLSDLSLILAPFIPYLTETVWQGLTKTDSIHLRDWPKINEKLIDKKLEEEMATIREIVTLGHSQRKAVNIKLRQPLPKLKIKSEKLKVSEKLLKIVKNELNVKEVEFKTGAGELKVELDTKLTPELIAEGEARDLIRQIQVLRKEQRLSLTDKINTYATKWPKDWENQIKTTTGTISLRKAEELKIERV